MEQLLIIIQQIYKLLSILNSYTQEEREELLVGYQHFLFETKELLITLDRIVGREYILGLEDRVGISAMALKDLSTTERSDIASRLGG